MCKFIIYFSDSYYPSAEFFDNEKDALSKWEKLKKDRLYDDPMFLRKDCIAKIIETNQCGIRDEND